MAPDKSGRLLVNPGSLMRQRADQVNHQPKIYLWWAASNSVKPVPVPIADGVISRDHIEHSAVRDQRIEAFISQLADDWQIGFSFEANIDQFLKENNVRQKVKGIIQRAIDERTTIAET